MFLRGRANQCSEPLEELRQARRLGRLRDSGEQTLTRPHNSYFFQTEENLSRCFLECAHEL